MPDTAAPAGSSRREPADSASAPRAWSDEQIRASLGAEWEIDQKWRIGFNYTYLWLGNNAVDAKATPLTGNVVGDYDASASLFGLYGSLRI